MRVGDPQTPAHLVIEQTTTYWILFGIPEVDVRADIVQFRAEVKAPSGSETSPPPPKPPDVTR
jgi:hypothetical protein